MSRRTVAAALTAAVLLAAPAGAAAGASNAKSANTCGAGFEKFTSKVVRVVTAKNADGSAAAKKKVGVMTVYVHPKSKLCVQVDATDPKHTVEVDIVKVAKKPAAQVGTIGRGQVKQKQRMSQAKVVKYRLKATVHSEHGKAVAKTAVTSGFSHAGGK